MCYISAIDDAVDPFSQHESEAGWDIASLCARAKNEMGFPHVLEGETSLLINAAREQRKVNIRETTLYMEALNRVRQLVRRVE